MIKYQTELGVSSAGRLHRHLSSYDDLMIITELERDGATVILEASGDQHIVKVRRDGQRQIRKASTSGYPVRAAFEAWKERQG